MKYQNHLIVLSKLKELIVKLSDRQYSLPNPILSGGTLGQHFRHIVEFYTSLPHSSKGFLCYDQRPRQQELETDRILMVQTLNQILKQIQKIPANERYRTLHLENKMSSGSPAEKPIPTSLVRELTYCLDHCIHHQSLIRIGLIEQGIEHLIDDEFGVAFSTLQYRKK